MASLRKRVSATWSFFWNGYSRRPSSKAMQFAWPTFMEGKPQWQMYDFETYAEEGYSVNGVIYSCVGFKARQIAMAPPRAYTGDPEIPVLVPPTSPVSKLLSRPNPHQSVMEFQMQCVTYLNLAGNVFILLDRADTNSYPQAMYSLRPDRVKIIPQKGGIKGYIYEMEKGRETEAIPILPQNMMHVKFPNPLDPLEGMGYGLSPIAPMARVADVDNSVSSFLKRFFDKGTQAFGFIEVPESLDSASIERLRDEWNDQYGGSDNWGTPLILDSGAKWNRGMGNFDELGFDAIDARNETRIHGPFGVPPILTGMRVGLEHATYSNYEEARKACWEDTLNPEINLFEADYNYYLSDGNTFVRHDRSRVPALRKNYKEMAEAAEIMIRNGVPPNRAFAVVGLDVGEIEGGETSYFPMSLVPAGGAAPTLPPPPVGGQTNEGAPNAAEEERVQQAALRLMEGIKKKSRSLNS